MQTISKIVTHYSLTKSIVRSEKLVEAAKKKGIKTLILADLDSLSGSVDFMKETLTNDIKSIIGVTLSITDKDLAPQGTITLLAKNLKGWKQLLKLVSRANSAEFYKDHPKLPASELRSIEGRDLIILVGGYNSTLADLIVDHEARFCSMDDAAKQFAKDNWSNIAQSYLEGLTEQFGGENVYLEVSRGNSALERILNLGVRYLGKKCGIACVPSNPIHYLEQDDWFDHHLMLCVGHKIKKSQLRDIKNVEDYPFICGPNFFLDTSDEGYTKEELENLEKMVEQCETYKVFSNPRLPKFNCPNNLSEPEYLRQLCREGWKKKIEAVVPTEKLKEYADRVKEELDIINDIDTILGEPLISRYFLIVQDYVNAARERGELINYGRGSAAGSIVANLINITDVDPIRYNLLFSRFFNKGRITKDKFSLPDIDIDFEVGKREDTIKYIKEKYGKSLVAQVVTFGALHGKGAIKEVLRINEAVPLMEIQSICDVIPDTSKIADDLQDMKDNDEEASNILWTLQNNADRLRKWCYLDEQNNLQGPLARLFEQAIRLEGTLKTQSSHASAVVLAPESLSNLCPMLHSKTKEDQICGLEFEYLESMGLLKCDILGVAELDKLNETKKLLGEKYEKNLLTR